MADLVADISEAEQRTIQAQKESAKNHHQSAPLEASDCSGVASLGYGANAAAISISQYEDNLPPPPADPMLDLPPPPPPPEPLSPVSAWGPVMAEPLTFFEAAIIFINLLPKAMSC
jgi:amyloid beta A4 precursor protein-binding family B protein 1-interacting protein